MQNKSDRRGWWGGEGGWKTSLYIDRPFSPAESFRIGSEQRKMKFTLFTVILFSIRWMSVVLEGEILLF